MPAVLVLRPEPGATATVSAARALGLEAIAAPLFEVRALDWIPPTEPPEAVLMTSAQAARLGGTGLALLRDRPLYAVGEATAAAARHAGFTRILVGDAGVDAVVARAARDGVRSLLHLAAREHRAPTIIGMTIERRLVYAAEPVPALPEAARAALPRAVALLHSPRAAALFASLVDPMAIRIAAISPAARDAAGEGWRAAAIAGRPTDASLLAAAAKLCNHEA
ncbi:uroporphyrinogen-III synthase [Sphingomonas sp. PR090111-T3T-6A]|uniref:uroporphyrinogen-III synthase n=1 Tax=Sphingomonas sp. PR090111-T3T-6A TaxID=685778 RepID=UPI000378538B|nr:uroporphyrinogen-III synthase [Sphingomonas sp. PR090111-T3T-6A]